MLMSKIQANKAFQDLEKDVDKVKESETDKLNKIIDAG